MNSFDSPAISRADRQPEIPFYSAHDRRNVTHAIAGMMAQAAFGNRPDSRNKGPEMVARTDAAYWEAVTGVPARSNRATTGIRALQTLGDRGLSLRITSGLDYVGFAEKGPSRLPEHIASLFARLRPDELMAEQYTTGNTIHKLDLREAHGLEPATMDDVRSLHGAGWMVKLLVDGSTIADNGQDFAMHSLLVTEVEDDKIFAHNPGGNGLRPQPHQAFSFDEIETAWAATENTLHAAGWVRQTGNDIISVNGY